MTEPHGRKLFVSYSRVDRPRVEALVHGLEAAGHSVWWDTQLTGGGAFAAETEAALEAADVVIVVWTQNSIGSNWVRDEAASGRDRARLVPIRLDDVTVPLGFRQFQWIDFVRWNRRGDAPEMATLLAGIARVAAAPGSAPAPAPRVSPVRRLGVSANTLRWGGAALLASAAALLVLATPAALVCKTIGLRCSPVVTTPVNSIAVLPFANLSGDAGQEYFSDGLSEELLAKLARLGALQVSARTSSFKFKGSGATSATIGKQLGVTYILDGSVRRNGSVVRVGAQLVEASTGFERWSQTYDRDMKDIFAVQTGIAEAVAEALRVKLLGGDIAALSSGGTTDPAAWDAYIRGKRSFDEGAGEAGYRDALARFDAAIARDPRFAAAYAARARTLVALANQFMTAAELRPTYDAALAAARRAVALAPTLTDAQTTLALTLVNANHDFAAAREAYAAALKTGGGDATTLTRFGLFSMMEGDGPEAISALQRAATLDPLNPRAHRSLGFALLAERRFDEAIAAQRRALELSPGASGAHAEIGKALLLQGKFKEARSEYALEPEAWERLTGEAIVFQRLGDTPRAKAAMQALIATRGDSMAYQQAQVLSQWGDTKGALAALQVAFRVGDSGLILMKSDRLMDPLQKLPAFQAMLARLGLEG